jgi:hypothetical protein
LTGPDSTAILSAYKLIKADFTDPEAEREYTAMKKAIEEVFSKIFRGDPSISDGPTDHNAVTELNPDGSVKRIHIDGNVFDSAHLGGANVNILAEILFHEGAHILRYPDHGLRQADGSYVEHPYSRVGGRAGVEQCVP